MQDIKITSHGRELAQALQQREPATLFIPEGDYILSEGKDGFELRLANGGLIVLMKFDRLAFTKFHADVGTVLSRSAAKENGA